MKTYLVSLTEDPEAGGSMIDADTEEEALRLGAKEREEDTGRSCRPDEMTASRVDQFRLGRPYLMDERDPRYIEEMRDAGRMF